MKNWIIYTIAAILFIGVGILIGAYVFPTCKPDCNELVCDHIDFIDLPAQEVDVKPIPPIKDIQVVKEVKYIEVDNPRVRDSLKNYYQLRQQVISNRYNHKIAQLQYIIDELQDGFAAEMQEQEKQIIRSEETKQINTYENKVIDSTYVFDYKIDVEDGILHAFKYRIQPKVPILNNTVVVDRVLKRKNHIFLTGGAIFDDSKAHYSVGLNYRRGAFMVGGDYFPLMKAIAIRGGVGIQF